MKKEIPESAFYPIYRRFKDKPKQAILHLKKVKKGDCRQALYRPDTGYVDIVWGTNDKKTNKGFGLKHIIEKHGKEIKDFGFEVEDFIPMAFKCGEFADSRKKGSLVLENENMRTVISLKAYDNIKGKTKKKKFILTSFVIIKKHKKSKAT